MAQMVTFTDLNSGEVIHVVASKLIGFTNWHKLGAKPEDKPVGVLVFVEGYRAGLLVKESYGRVLNIFRTAGLVIEG
jgi:hypothetical protein